ncbi:hypothetical protein HOK96_03220 [bacterium]|nr:hypothetical protein [bacterium]MBT4577897.1 hypothetical protein [bacterium]MBT5346030.1 hypothetical protein [bacterium]
MKHLNVYFSLLLTCTFSATPLLGVWLEGEQERVKSEKIIYCNICHQMGINPNDSPERLVVMIPNIEPLTVAQRLNRESLAKAKRKKIAEVNELIDKNEEERKQFKRKYKTYKKLQLQQSQAPKRPQQALQYDLKKTTANYLASLKLSNPNPKNDTPNKLVIMIPEIKPPTEAQKLELENIARANIAKIKRQKIDLERRERTYESWKLKHKKRNQCSIVSSIKISIAYLANN